MTNRGRRKSSLVVTNARISLQAKAEENYEGILPPPKPEHEGKLCVVLDMDETLIHSKVYANEKAIP